MKERTRDDGDLETIVFLASDSLSFLHEERSDSLDNQESKLKVSFVFSASRTKRRERERGDEPDAGTFWDFVHEHR